VTGATGDTGATGGTGAASNATGGTGGTGPGSAKSRTLWFWSAGNVGGTDGASAAKCLSHELGTGTNATCTGTGHNFTYHYDVKAAGTVTSLWAEAEVAPGGADGVNITTVTVRRNGLATTGNFFNCTITGAAFACENNVGSITVGDGDFLSVTVKETTGNGADGQWKTYVTLQ
jgi:hypothetical protein